MSEAEKRELQELISLLYGNNISQYGKRCLVQYIEKLQKENEEYHRIKKELIRVNKKIYDVDTIDELIETIDKLQKENKELKDNQLWSEATIEGLKERFIPKEKIEAKIKEYEDMLKTLNKKSDTDRIKAINERIIGYKELLGF